MIRKLTATIAGFLLLSAISSDLPAQTNSEHLRSPNSPKLAASEARRSRQEHRGLHGLYSQDTSFARLDNDTGISLSGAIFSADLNGDGKPDVVVNAYTSQTYLLFGNGDGTFSAAKDFSSCCILGIADVNGDGKPDLIVADGSLSVYLGNGDGTFQTARHSPTVASGPAVFRDVNHDGKVDAILIQQGGGIAVQLGNGDGTFQTAQSFSSGEGEGWEIVAGDFNGDGNVDIAVTNSGTAPNFTDATVVIFLGNGDGTFGAATTFPTGSYATGLVAADFNGDNKLDLAVANYESSSVSVFIGRGDGTFDPRVDYPVNGNPFLVSAADFDGDGKLDLAVGAGASALSILRGNGDGTFGPKQDFPAFGAFEGDTIADFNQDGKPDVGVVYNSGSSTLSVFLNTSGPGIATTTTLISSLNPSSFGQAVTFTATVSSSAGTPTGSVTFYDGSTSLGSSTLANGNGSVSTSSLSVGSHSITAAYQGSGGFDSSTSAVLTQVVNSGPAPTSTSLSSSGNPCLKPCGVTFTATVTSAAGTPTGTVTFSDDEPRGLGTATLSNGVASVAPGGFHHGTWQITATYNGSTDFAPSTSPVLYQDVYEQPVPTQTYVSTSGSPSFIGQPVTFSAGVSPNRGSIPDGQTLTFYDGHKPLGTVPMTNERASLTISSLDVGKHTILVTYDGNALYEKSHGTVAQIVVKYSTTTTLVSSVNPSVSGQPVTMTVTVTSSAPQTPTGVVMIKGFGALTLVGGTASATKSNFKVGSHSLTAKYKGDDLSAASTSEVLVQVVNPD